MTLTGLGLLRDLLKAMPQGASLAEVLRTVTDTVVVHLDTEGAGIWVRHEGGDLELVALTGTAFPRDPGVVSGVVHDRRPSTAEDSVVVHPLMVGDRILGAMGLWRSAPWTAEERALVEAVADAVAAAADRRQAEEQTALVLSTLNEIGRTLVAELNLERVVQIVTDAATRLTGAAFGAFFYNVVNERGEALMLYTLSGAPRSAFEDFGLPRNTAVFGPTFAGEGTVRHYDVTAAAHYGQNPPHRGMPEGHLPVRSYLAVPVIARSHEVLGGLFFGHPEPGQFTATDEDLVEGIAGYAAVGIENARQFREEQHIALTLQRALLPRLADGYDRADIAVRYLPSVEHAEVGGDWYDVATLGDGRLAVTVGDVEGHSVEAAARMGTVRHALSVLTRREESTPAAALWELDRHLTQIDLRALVTAVHAVFDPSTGSLQVARAGHLPPVLLDPDGTAELLDEGMAPALGLRLVRRPPPLVHRTLAPGSAVVFYTDGLVERPDRPLDEGLELLRSALAHRTFASAEEVCDHVIDELLGPRGSRDDVALLVLRTVGAGHALAAGEPRRRP
jgi:serine phosphatase RsbU (regulator of sigma subunit)